MNGFHQTRASLTVWTRQQGAAPGRRWCSPRRCCGPWACPAPGTCRRSPAAPWRSETCHPACTPAHGCREAKTFSQITNMRNSYIIKTYIYCIYEKNIWTRFKSKHPLHLCPQYPWVNINVAYMVNVNFFYILHLHLYNLLCDIFYLCSFITAILIIVLYLCYWHSSIKHLGLSIVNLIAKCVKGTCKIQVTFFISVKYVKSLQMCEGLITLIISVWWLDHSINSGNEDLPLARGELLPDVVGQQGCRRFMDQPQHVEPCSLRCFSARHKGNTSHTGFCHFRHLADT